MELKWSSDVIKFLSSKIEFDKGYGICVTTKSLFLVAHKHIQPLLEPTRPLSSPSFVVPCRYSVEGAFGIKAAISQFLTTALNVAYHKGIGRPPAPNCKTSLDIQVGNTRGTGTQKN